MNYVNFMRKLEGKEPQHDITDSTTSGARPLDLQGIIEFARGLGYPECDLAARPEVPTDHRADIFWAGYDGWPSYRATLGMYGDNPSCFFWAGWEYQQQQGNTHSQQQDRVPAETQGEYVRSDWVIDGDYVDLGEIRAINRRLERFAMGSPSPSPQPREEPEGGVLRGAYELTSCWFDEYPLCSTTRAEESGVSSICDERESSERSAEDTERSNRYRMERSTGWSFR
jgi:hypothetical protein